MLSDLPLPDLALPVPMFPLPGCVLFPHAMLPLHIFEPRYRAMLAHATEGEQLIAMALLRDDADAQASGDCPAVHEVVCVGRLAACEGLPDGRSNVLLHGLCRARWMGDDLTEEGFRLARLAPLPPAAPVADAKARESLEQLACLLEAPRLTAVAAAGQIARLARQGAGLGPTTDLISFHLIANALIQQQLLSQPSPIARAQRLAELLQEIVSEPTADRDASDQRFWALRQHPN